MKLILILILCLMHLSLQEERGCNILGKLSKGVKLTTDQNNLCVYIDTNEFPNDSEIPVKATINDGSSQENAMYYRTYGTEPNKNDYFTLPVFKTSNIHSMSGYTTSYSSHFNYYSSYFQIPKGNERFLIVAFPTFSAKNSEIEISAPFPLWAIITIACVGSAIIIAAVIITIVCCIKKYRKRNNYISPLPSSDDTAPINPPENETY